ncbi:MAG: hypothetical protein IIA30_11940 [Myxococcales bacterium]|nr:hypothetical protein [Myxococcales bacterium]
MQRFSKLSGLFLLLAAGATVTAAAFPASTTMFHERKEVAGLAVVFGAEPEPALTDEMQFLRWRVSSLADDEPYTDFEDAKVTIKRDGEEFGPFTVRHMRRNPGQYQTQHIFTAAGEYESVLSFRKGEDKEVHTVDFSFRIRDRATLEIPARRHVGR